MEVGQNRKAAAWKGRPRTCGHSSDGQWTVYQ